LTREGVGASPSLAATEVGVRRLPFPGRGDRGRGWPRWPGLAGLGTPPAPAAARRPQPGLRVVSAAIMSPC